MKFLALLFALLLPVASFAAQSAQFYSTNLANLIEPAKLATLGKRGANPRIQKAVAMLEIARRDGYSVAVISSNAVRVASYTNAMLAFLTFKQLQANYGIAEGFGVLNETGLKEMQRGKSPTITLGPHKGDELSVDHIVPYKVAPELGNIIANLELMPLRLNEEKNAKMGPRQRGLANGFSAAGLLSNKRLQEILGKAK